MRPFFKRRTYETTLFGLPILTMHGLKEEDVIVDFCRAEVLIYDTLVRIFREKINGMPGSLIKNLGKYYADNTQTLPDVPPSSKIASGS